jgi:hypothetical protein
MEDEPTMVTIRKDELVWIPGTVHSLVFSPSLYVCMCICVYVYLSVGKMIVILRKDEVLCG